MMHLWDPCGVELKGDLLTMLLVPTVLKYTLPLALTGCKGTAFPIAHVSM